MVVLHACDDGLPAISEHEPGGMHCSVIDRSLVERGSGELDLRGLELEKHERLEGAGPDDSIAALGDTRADLDRYLHTNERLRIAVVLDQGAEERLADMLLGGGGDALFPERAIYV